MRQEPEPTFVRVPQDSELVLGLKAFPGVQFVLYSGNEPSLVVWFEDARLKTNGLEIDQMGVDPYRFNSTSLDPQNFYWMLAKWKQHHMALKRNIRLKVPKDVVIDLTTIKALDDPGGVVNLLAKWKYIDIFVNLILFARISVRSQSFDVEPGKFRTKSIKVDWEVFRHDPSWDDVKRFVARVKKGASGRSVTYRLG